MPTENTKDVDVIESGTQSATKADHLTDANFVDHSRYQRIAEAAYYNAERRGFTGDQALEDWLTAEQQIDAAQASSPDLDKVDHDSEAFSINSNNDQTVVSKNDNDSRPLQEKKAAALLTAPKIAKSTKAKSTLSPRSTKESQQDISKH